MNATMNESNKNNLNWSKMISHSQERTVGHDAVIGLSEL